MRIVIVGCGKVGQTLTKELSKEGHDITVIDTKEDKVNKLVQEYDVMGVIGNGINPETQQDAEIDKADLLISMTGNDEFNLLCCLMSKKTNQRLKTIARVESPEYQENRTYLKTQLGISLITNPDLEAAREIYRVLRLPSAISVDTFSKELAEILKFKVLPGSILDGMPIKFITSRLKSDILVCVMERDGKAFIPDGEFTLKAKDLLSIAGDPASTNSFFKKIGLKKKSIKNIMIIGAGRVTYYLGKMLEKTGVNLTIIESNPAQCERMAQLLPKATFILGDGSDQQLLIEEGLDQMDAFIALTGIDEENIFLSLYAGGKSDLKTITKVNRILFDDVIKDLDLDTIVYPKMLITELTLRYVRSMSTSVGDNIETIYKLAGDQAEAVEFKIKKDSPVLGIPIQNLHLKQGRLVALIQRKGKIILPRGSDSMQEGDSVVVVTNTSGLSHLHDIVEKHIVDRHLDRQQVEKHIEKHLEKRFGR